MSKHIFIALLVLSLAMLACGFAVNLPQVPTPGPSVTEKISVNAPDAKSVSLKLTFGAGELSLASGAGKSVVTGTATYNIPDLKPEVKQDGSSITVKQGEYQGLSNMDHMTNKWDLALGEMPMDLTITAGAYDGKLDLGGLALTNLTINDGASQMKADFSSANKEKMSILSYKTGASNVTLKDLANANAATITFDSGVGNYTLDFGGTLQRDVSVNIHSGISNVTLVIPAGLAATVRVEGGLSNAQFPSGWTQNGQTYTQAGTGPALTVVINMGAGNLQVTQ
jgi:hypothetical protein